MAGSFYYQLQQCGTLNTAVGSSSSAYTIGTVFADTINGICWEIIGTDLGPSYTIDLDTLIGVIDCNDPICNPVTPTITPTPSVTPPPCSCGEYTFVVDANDILNATGNTSNPNGIVFWEYTDCNGNFVQDQFGSAGSFTECLCVNLATYYWQLDAQQGITPPSYNGPCLIPTDTPTPTPTETPTMTPTPNLPYSLQIQYNYNDGCFDLGCIFGFDTPEEACAATGLTLTVYSTASTISNGTELFFDDKGQVGFLTNFFGYLYWNNNSFVCTGGTVEQFSVCLAPGTTPTPTPTETPTQTPSETPTQTPTETLSITPTPTPTAINVDCSSCSGTGWLPYDSTTCYRINVTGATAPVTPISLAPHDVNVYSSFGTRFYETGFPTSGIGTVQVELGTPIVGGSYTGATWSNPNSLTTVGPLNRCAIWTNPFTSTPTNTWIGFSDCLSGISATKTYYVGIGADNEFRLVLDGVEILNTVGNVWTDQQFKWWHVYPIEIGAGNHTIELYGLNLGSDAGFGCEIYDNTLEDLTGFTDYSQINVVYTNSGATEATIVQDLSGNYLSSGYTCPSGYVYSTCSGSCVEYEFCSVATTPTPTPTITPSETPTQTPSETPTQTPSETPTQTPTLSPGASPNPTPTPTETPTQTPSDTPTNTPTETPTETPTQTPSDTPTNTPTETPTETPTQTPTETPTQTPTLSPGASPNPTPTPTETPTQTPSETPTETPTQTPSDTPTNTPTETPTETPTQTPTETPTSTPTPSISPSPTQTPTNSQTPSNTPTQTQTPTSGYIVCFEDCVTQQQFRFLSVPFTMVVGTVYHITASTEYEGCATVIASGGGPFFNGTGVTFTQAGAGCGDPICPRVPSEAALLLDCRTDAVFYANVDVDTAFVGAVYEYNNSCYRFEEFSGPGGPDLGSPDWGDCVSCLNNTPTPTPYSTPTVTPTVSSTPAPCTFTDFCFTTTLPSLSNYNGQYTVGANYNGRPSYSGGSISIGYVYYFTSVTESYWCLSTSLGGPCLLQGSSPCYSSCPDISFGSFVSGVCPTPTPTPIDCNPFDFNAYFDCDWEPVPTPSVSIACDDVAFDINSISITPTPTPTGVFCTGKAVDFSINFVPDTTPTPTVTPTLTLTRTVPASGQVTFNIFDETFSCVSVKVLNQCGTENYFYTSDPLVYNGSPIQIGMVMLVVLNGEIMCVKYEKDDVNLSSNSNVDVVIDIYGNNCSNCSTVVTPTPSVTATSTPTPSATVTLTPTQTPSSSPTNTPTPSPTATIGLTPTATPRPSYSSTPTPTVTPSVTPNPSLTPTMTPTPSPTPDWRYVYSSCSGISPNIYPTYMIQTVQSPIQTNVGLQFKDSQGNCWTYEGRFESNYIAPPLTVSQTYSGDYFAGTAPITFTSCTECQQIVISPCTLIYFNATVCSTNESIVVKACDLGPCQQLNFGISSGLFCVTPQVGSTVTVSNSNGGDDICVVLNSLTTATTTPYDVVSPTYANFAFCSCSLYRVYSANSCDGLDVGKAIYDLVTNPIISNGTVVGTDVKCYTIVSYVGIKNVYPFLPGIAPSINTSYNDCDACVNPES